MHYVIVRTDLPKGIQAAQIVHAAGESSPGNLPEGTFAVVLAAPNEKALKTIARRLAEACIRFVPISEPDPPYCGQLMALGLVPKRKEELRRQLSSLPLLR